MATLSATSRLPAGAVSLQPRPLAAFLGELFARLDAHGLRYCVLHGYESLPDTLASDLDLALHPADLPGLRDVVAALRQGGFLPVQRIDYDVDSHYIVFAWLDGGAVRTVAVDVTAEHRQGHFILQRGDALVEGRRRRGAFWIPSASAEFGYLLSKKIVKVSAADHQVRRLQALAVELGEEATATEAGRLVGPSWQARVAAWCRDGSLADHIVEVRREFGRAMARREPFNVLRYVVSDLPRKVRRWLEPSGLFVTVLGPDGVGKSTLIAAVEAQLGGAFRRTCRFHWRPMWAGGRANESPASGPHGRRAHGTLRSCLRSALHLADYIGGYLARVRPALLRSALVIFDRYAGDMLVDPARYRHGGPRWVLRLVDRLAPSPDLQLILDAPAERVASRKQEVAVPELRRQRQAFLDLAARHREAVVLDASQPAADVAREAALAVVEYLSARFQQRYPAWTATPRDSGHSRGPCEPWLTLQSSPGDWGRGQPSIALPSVAHVRWIVPAADLRVTRRALGIYTPYAPAARAAKVATAWTLGLLPYGLLPSTLRHEACVTPDVGSLVREVLGIERPLYSVCIGAPGAYRKATVQVQHADGTVAAYLKLPLTETASARIRHEAEVLTQLQRHGTLSTSVPRVLYAGARAGGDVLMVSPVAGGRGPVRFSQAHLRFLADLAEVAPVDRDGLVVADEVAAQWGRVAVHVPVAARTIVARVLDDTRGALQGVTLPCGLGHGDFAPWNTRRVNGGITVFDWDRAEYDVPRWWDVFHFEVQVGSLLGRRARGGFRCDEHPGSHAAFVLYLVRSMTDALLEDPSDPRGLEFRTVMLDRYRAPDAWAQPGLPC